MKLFKKQRDSIKNSTARLNFWVGSVRSGKSHVTIIRWIKFLGSNPYNGFFMIGKTIGTLKRNIINPMQTLLGNSCRHYPGKQEFKVFDKTCYLFGANDESSEGKIRGATCPGALGDEITLWPESFYRMLLSRLSLPGAQFFGTTNTDNPNHYLKTDTLDNADLDLAQFHFELDDNIFLDKEYIKNIKKEYVGLWYRRFILGLWCIAEGAIYDFFDEDEHTLTTTPKAENYYIGIDYGTNNPCGFLLFGHNSRTKPIVWAEREYYYDSKKARRQKTDEEYSNDLQDFCKEYLGKNWKTRLSSIIIDPSAASFKLRLKRDGFLNIKDADNSVIDGIRDVSSILKNGNYAISQNCKQLIAEKYGYVWDDKAQKRGIDQPLKVGDHLSDAERYFLRSYTTGSLSSFNILSQW